MSEREFTAAVRPSPESGLGFSSWFHEIVEAARATLATPEYPEDLPRGNGQSVLLLPGFLAGDWTMRPLRDFLKHLGYQVEFAGISFNLGPTPHLIPHLEQTVERLYAERGEKLVLVGQSLGGSFARALAYRHPGKIAHVITLCSPVRFPVATPLEAIVRWLTPLHGPDVVALLDEITGTPQVPITAVYSRRDGIVDWRCCLQDESATCKNIEVPGAHSAMGFIPEAQAVVARALAQISHQQETS